MTTQQKIEEEVFKQIFIPRQLDEVNLNKRKIVDFYFVQPAIRNLLTELYNISSPMLNRGELTLNVLK